MSDTATRPKVVEPDALGPEEKETIIRFGKTDGRAVVFSEQRGPVARLLRHPEAEARSITLADGSTVEDVEELGESDTVIGYRGTVPVGTLKVRLSARDTAAPGPVISDGGEQ
jgi:hypothetical protein